MKHSVIVTGYNCEKYAAKCIDSLLNQTVQPHQILIYNDCSIDSTAQVLEKYKHLPSVTVWNNSKNMGALFGRYTYIQQTVTGDVVSFVGLDDYLAPNALEVLNRYYTDDIKLTYGNWQRVGTNQVNEAQHYGGDVYRDKSFRRSGWKATALNTFRTELIKRVPKELLQHDGKFFDNCTDLAYSFPCLENVEQHEVAVVTEPIYKYRIHGNTTLSRLGRDHKTNIREQLKRIKICKL